MREIKGIEDQIKTEWFDEHKATITKYDSATILDWKKDGSSNYSVRYIFSGSNLYISGDIGGAIFNLTWKATPESFDGVNLGYFLGKMSCHSRDRWYFDERKAKNDLREWCEEVSHGEDGKCLNEINKVRKKIIEIIESVSTPKELELRLFDYYETVSFDYIDADDFSVFSDFGKKLSNVFVAYLLGIKMANEQLNVTL
ncbi:hypothetical protein HXA34_20180 [Salipaludibacillus agaradhaerens]|jgi:hypothetical protein|uniref:hypothetical protein n=1 Tax=Salipaludibacillus agaradhaerens TaxID=76935 RepID=UPI0021507C54|nr:hypothetical protein [Salipaludibacillus agaradhaerens]MCR6108611.1 hypothetical protein [Salipaludibacillus agaradhaerens]MCR6120639.1 hypothetical protein [Salipaludibacillus agaradhaerens]